MNVPTKVYLLIENTERLLMHRRAQKDLVALFLFLASGSSGQDLRETAPPGVTPDLLKSLSLEPARRSSLQAAILRRDYAAAESLLVEEATRDPQSQPILLVLANILFLDAKHLNCAVVLKKAEKLAPLDERSRFLLALSYVTIGRSNLAHPELEKLVQANPFNAVYPYWLARLAYRRMDIRSAVQHALKAIQLDPAFMKAYDQLGLCYGVQADWDAAIQAFQEAVRLNGQMPVPSPWPSTNLGTLLLRLERLDDAEVTLRQAISIDGRFPIAHYRLGQVLEKKARYEDAIAELKQAAGLDPTYPEPHYALARIYRQRRDSTAAGKEISIFQDLRRSDKQRGVIRPD